MRQIQVGTNVPLILAYICLFQNDQDCHNCRNLNGRNFIIELAAVTTAQLNKTYIALLNEYSVFV
jgi:hypothetical protein